MSAAPKNEIGGTQKALLAIGTTGCGVFLAGCGLIVAGALLSFGLGLVILGTTAKQLANATPPPPMAFPKLKLKTPKPTMPPLLAAHDLAILSEGRVVREDHERVAQFDKALEMFQERHPSDSKNLIKTNLHVAFNRCESELGRRPDLVQLTLIALEIDRAGTQPNIQAVMREAAAEYIRRQNSAKVR